MLIGKTMFRSAAVAAGALTFAFAAAPLQAAVLDPVGDFLSTYVGPQNGDLDVTRVEARLTDPGQVRLTGEHAGAIGATEDSAYVWGIDRGEGAEDLAELDPPAGLGVAFDAVAVLVGDGTGFVLDLRAGTGPTSLDPSAIEIAGDMISVTLTEALLPSRGLDFADYEYNLWPRYAPGGVDPTDNTQISDFAPDSSTFSAVIPLPAALGLQLAGLAIFVAVRRRRA